jgi:hypothetical protein
VIEEAAVLGGERRLDHVIGNFFQRNGVIAQQAALADLVAIAIQEGDAEFVGEVDLALRDFEGGQGKCEHDQESGHAQRQCFASQLIAGAPESLDLETAEEGRIGAPPVAEADPGAIEAGIDP